MTGRSRTKPISACGSLVDFLLQVRLFPFDYRASGRFNSASTLSSAFWLRWLYEMMVEPGFRRAAAIFLLSPAGQRRQHNVLQAGLLPQPASDFVAVHPRHPDVEEYDIGRIALRHLQRRRAAVGYPDLVALQLEQHGEAIGGVLIVIHDQQPMARRRRRPLRLLSRPLVMTSFNRMHRDRQPHDEFAPLPSPSLRASTVPSCISTRFFTRVRPMPSPPCAFVEAWSTCTNNSKMWGSMSGAMPMPLSRTRSTASSPSRSAVSQMRPFASVYLAALVRRLPTTWASRTGSASRSRDSFGSRTLKSWPCASTSGCTVSTARATTVASSMRSLRSSILPRMTRDTSSRSSTSRTR